MIYQKNPSKNPMKIIPRNHPRWPLRVDQDNFVEEVPVQVAQVMEEMKEAITKTSKAGPSDGCWVKK